MCGLLTPIVLPFFTLNCNTKLTLYRNCFFLSTAISLFVIACGELGHNG